MSTRRSFLMSPPARGMNTRDLKVLSDLHARQIINFRLGRSGILERRAGHELFCSDFTARSFLGTGSYVDRNNTERILAVNNGQIIEFNENSKTNRYAVSASKQGHFVNALGAIFYCNGINNVKGFDETWSPIGIENISTTLNLTATNTGGSLADGDYIVRASFAIKSGASYLLIGAHDFPTTITLAGGTSTQKITVNGLPTGADPRVTHIIIWVTLVDSGVEYFSSEAVNGTASMDILAEPDSGGLAYEDYSDNTNAGTVFNWLNYGDNRLWGIPLSTPTSLFASNRGTHYDLECFPTASEIGMSLSGKPLKFCHNIQGDEIAMTEFETVILKGSDLLGSPYYLSEKIGTKNPYSWAPWNNGLIGFTNRGIEYFDGDVFHILSDDVYNLFKNDLNAENGFGVVVDDPKYGEIYKYCARLPNDIVGGTEFIPGYGYGIGIGGSGQGIPSDDFGDLSINTSRWTAVGTTGDRTISEEPTGTSQGLKLHSQWGDLTAGDTYLDLNNSFGEPYNIIVDTNMPDGLFPANGAIDVEQFMQVYIDANNYVEIAYRVYKDSIATPLKYIKASVMFDGTLTAIAPALITQDEGGFMIRLIRGRMFLFYKDDVGAWTNLSATNNAWTTTGWKIKLGQRTVVGKTSDEFGCYFKNLRVQCNTTSGYEAVTDDSVNLLSTNIVMNCYLRNWSPKIWDDDIKAFISPAWTQDALRAQMFLPTRSGKLLVFDSSMGRVLYESENTIFDNQELIPCLLITKILDFKDPTVIKWCYYATITGNWGQPFSVMQICHPELETDTDTVMGFNSGTPMDLTAMINNALANTDGVYYTTQFRKMKGNGFQFLISKFDDDASFAIEKIGSQVNYSRAQK